MANVKEPAGPGFAVFTFLALIGLVAVVALLINSYDTESDVAAVDAATSSASSASAPASPGPATGAVPVGGVATGGGGMATDGSGSLAFAVFGGLAALTLLTASGMVLRQREA